MSVKVLAGGDILHSGGHPGLPGDPCKRGVPPQGLRPKFLQREIILNSPILLAAARSIGGLGKIKNFHGKRECMAAQPPMAVIGRSGW